jgi:hypothetical protein
MMREADVSLLVQNLRQAEALKPKELSKGVRYLLEHLYAPLMADQTVMIGDIDFTRFTHAESWDFAAYINGDVAPREAQGAALFSVFSRACPRALRRSTFF